MAWGKPILSGENSIITSLAVAALVGGVYMGAVGPVSDVHATDANDINMHAGIRKAGVMSLGLVLGAWFLSRDHNILILGGATIIAEELSYRHANMTEPQSGALQVNPSSYSAPNVGANVTPIAEGVTAYGLVG